jgi:hypothetical protein
MFLEPYARILTYETLYAYTEYSQWRLYRGRIRGARATPSESLAPQVAPQLAGLTYYLSSYICTAVICIQLTASPKLTVDL